MYVRGARGDNVPSNWVFQREYPLTDEQRESCPAGRVAGLALLTRQACLLSLLRVSGSRRAPSGLGSRGQRP